MDFEIIGLGRFVTLNLLQEGLVFATVPVYGNNMVEADGRKLAGFAVVRLTDDSVHTAEIHWYEAHGIGRREFKIKFPLRD